jgi:hypothetical protein
MKLTTLAILLFSLLATPAAFGNLINNSGFETGDLTGWTVNPIAIDNPWTVVTGDPYVNAPQSGSYFAGTGCTGAPCFSGPTQNYFYQDVPTADNQLYLIAFYWDPGYCSDPDCTGELEELQVLWGATTILDFQQEPTGATDPGWQFFSAYETGDLGTTRLEFIGQQDPAEIGIDTVMVEPAPEPSGALLLGGASVLLAWLRKRREAGR